MNSFLQQLARFRRRHRAGRLAAWCIVLHASAGVLALVFATCDLAFAFEPAARHAIVKTLAIGFAIITIAGVYHVSRIFRPRSAELADEALDAPAQPISAALTTTAVDTPLGGFLAQRACAAAADQLAALPARHAMPMRALRRAVWMLGAVAFVLVALRIAAPGPFGVSFDRLLHPKADIPPWTKLHFVLDPAQPAVVYGQDLLVACSITGDTPRFPIECLIREPQSGTVLRLPVARESDTRMSRKLEALTQPVEIAFACGKARSKWQPVEILLEPRILAATLRLTPPAYTGLQVTATPLDTGTITAIEGSQITLELTSNRPLGSAAITFTPARQGTTVPQPETITGDIADTHTAVFQFPAARSGALAASVSDVRGTPAASPMTLMLDVRADLAPEIDLTSPPPMLLATPESAIPLTARANDDFGLARMRLVRTLAGFRDRSQSVASGLTAKQHDFSDRLELAKLGLTPGQTIELFLEAADHNPSLLGQGASGISRIHIISEDDYARRLRAKTTLEEFSARYQAVAKVIVQAREALDAMDRAANTNDAAKVELARQQAAAAHRETAELLDKLANDFPAFALEKQLKELAAERAATARRNLDDLTKFDAKASEGSQRRAIAAMRERLGGGRQPELDRLLQQAATASEAGKLLESAAKFQQIYQTQQSLVKRIETIAREIARGNDQNKRLLQSLADTQQKNREALDALISDLENRAAEIKDPALKKMADSAHKFAESLRMSDPMSVMDAAAKHGRDGSANDDFTNTELARAMLEKFLQQQNDFAQACRGQCPSFSVPDPDVRKTMQQLLEGLMCQNPGMSPNQGAGGGGMGTGGTGPTGSAQPGFAMNDLPVIGPQRLYFEPLSMGGQGRGEGRGGTPRQVTQAAETSVRQSTASRESATSAPAQENVPESYRDAVKRYFTPESRTP